MTYTLIWRHTAVSGLVRLRAFDADAAKAVRIAVGALAEQPYPDTSTALGGTGERRLLVGPARVLYAVDEDDACVDILTVGRSPG